MSSARVCCQGVQQTSLGAVRKVESCNTDGAGVIRGSRIKPSRLTCVKPDACGFQLQSSGQHDAKQRRTRSRRTGPSASTGNTGGEEILKAPQLRTDYGKTSLGVRAQGVFLSVFARRHRVVDQDAVWAMRPQGIHCDFAEMF